MNKNKSLWPYILLNILISAATTLLVLWLWDRANTPQLASQPPKKTATIQIPTEPIEATAVETPALPPLNQPVIKVKNVFGQADLQTEVVVLKRIGEGELWLTGWKLQNEKGESFIFPDLQMHKDAEIQIYSRAGVNSALALYWNRSAPAWKTGDLVTLVDYQGNIRASYRIP
jgi:hypothetical protein